jgi:hypothetical protein
VKVELQFIDLIRHVEKSATTPTRFAVTLREMRYKRRGRPGGTALFRERPPKVLCAAWLVSRCNNLTLSDLRYLRNGPNAVNIGANQDFRP